jgi:hypothetical protein
MAAAGREVTLIVPTVGTLKTLRPTQTGEVLQAPLLSLKALLRLIETALSGFHHPILRFFDSVIVREPAAHPMSP